MALAQAVICGTCQISHNIKTNTSYLTSMFSWPNYMPMCQNFSQTFFKSQALLTPATHNDRSKEPSGLAPLASHYPEETLV